MPCSDCSPAFTALEKLKKYNLLSTIRSNHAPFTFQRTELVELISHAEKELVKYREATARLQEMIISLENEKENLKGQVQLAKSLVAPIRKLPPEILRQIFIGHGTVNLIDSSHPKADIPGFKLASICSHWRSVALVTPGLWNNISLRLSGSHPVSYVSLVEYLLELSSKFKLGITITAHTDASVPACLAILCNQANRWQSLAGTLFGINAPLLEVLSSIQRRLDSLRTCKLYAPLQYYRAWVEGARNLHTADVFNIDPSSNTIPWDQIVNLTVYQSYPPSIARSLANSPNLHSCSIDSPCVIGLNDSNYVLQDLVHSNLHSLKFVIRNSDEETRMSKLLEVLVLPKLQSFSIKAKSHKINQVDLRWSSKELPSLISRSSALITTFNLDEVWVPTADLIALLKSMPTLTILFLSEPAYGEGLDVSPMINDQFFSTLYCHQHHQPVLTHLTSLTLNRCQVFNVEVIHSRWKPPALANEVACIQTVKLEAANITIPRNAIQTLMMLFMRGLDISLKDKDGEVSLWEEEI